jgi:predicted transcriptional regulator
MLNFFKKNIYYFVFIFLILFGYLGVKIFSINKVFIPEQFNKSRQQTALISQDIINLSNQIKNNLTTINELDQKKEYKEAFNLIDKTNLTILDVRQKSIELAKELELMTKSLNDLKAQGAEKFAINAITTRLTIINHLINYSDYLFQLNLALQKRFYGSANKEEITNLIDKINNEIEAINKANNEAEEYMTGFDKAIK